jgi:signal transduction histidine kinase
MMEKEQINTDVECPVCHSLIASTLHSSHCSGEEIVEVIPPERRKRQLRCGHEEVEPSAFPLVSAAHEFKTPLVVMLGYTDLLLNGHLGGINQRQKQVLGEIQEGAQRLQKLIQDLLLLQELKAGRIVAQNQESTSVDESVSEIFNYWAPTATQKRIRYQFNPSEGNERVRVEPLKLQHIISNLIENALKHTPSQGLVTVTVTPCFWERRKAQSEFLFNMERKENRKVQNAVRIT